MAIELTNVDFDEQIKGSVPVLVDFWAPWCGPCRSQGPILDALEKETEGELKVCKVNVDDEQEIARRFGVMSIPTLIVFKDGEVAGKAVGVQSAAALKKLAGI